MGSAKDKRGIRESFAKVTCLFAKNGRLHPFADKGILINNQASIYRSIYRQFVYLAASYLFFLLKKHMNFRILPSNQNWNMFCVLLGGHHVPSFERPISFQGKALLAWHQKVSYEQDPWHLAQVDSMGSIDWIRAGAMGQTDAKFIVKWRWNWYSWHPVQFCA